jgi:Bacteriophage tail sheath protein
MATYTRPGVFVNQTTAPLATSAGQAPGVPVACFAANYNVGPTVPTFLSSWQQFVQLYGGFTSGSSSYLPFAVYQFFTNGGTGCYAFRVPNSDAVQAAASVLPVEPLLSPPAAPTVTPTTGTGTVAAGTYQVIVTYVDPVGETTGSTATPAVLSATGELIVTSPAASGAATNYYVYCSQAGAGSATATRQQALGSPTLLGTSFTISAPPTSSGALPPATNTSGVSGPAMVITAKNPGVYGNQIYFTITTPSGAGTSTSTFNLQVFQGGTTSAFLVESWNGISLNPQSSRYAASVVNSTTSGSAYIILSGLPASYVAGTNDPKTVSTPTALGSTAGGSGNPISASTLGSDGTTPIDLNWAITGSTAYGGTAPSTPAWNQGHLTSFGNQVINLNLPDTSLTGSILYSLINNLLTWANAIGNVYLVIDSQFQGGQASSSSVATAMAAMTTSGVAASTLAAIYGPWLSIPDPLSTASGATRWLPPGGAVLGYWEQNDLLYTIAQAPAGNTAILNAVALEAYFTPSDLAILETAMVNPIKIVPQAGFCIYGALTTQASYPARYVNNSRVILKIANDLTAITSFAVFQNNTPTLWQNLTNVITNYLTNQMQAGVLAGTTPATSFQVICDSTVNTPTTVQAGVVNAQVAVAVASPAEFVVISLSQQQSGATTTISS